MNSRGQCLEFVKSSVDKNIKYEDFLIEWAYIESCERLDDTILTKIYSYNGNLSIWKGELVKKYKNKFLKPPFLPKNINLEISIFIKIVNSIMKMDLLL
jgi:hypothetical protein